jgi:predicted O-linked N-acetylglucosamine transferase (SPINDLY family)
MNSLEDSLLISEELKKQAYQAYQESNYQTAIELYQQLVSVYPDHQEYYFYSGLNYLLCDQYEPALSTWQTLIEREDDFVNIEIVTLELSQFLDQEANYQTKNIQIDKSIQIRDCLHEINPYYLSNLLNIIILLLNKKELISDKITELDIFLLLESNQFIPLNDAQINNFIESTLKSYSKNEIVIQLVEQVCQCHPQHSALINKSLKNIVDRSLDDLGKAIPLISMGNRLYPEDIRFYIVLSRAYLTKNNFSQSIQVAQQFYKFAQSLNSAQSLNFVGKFMACDVLLFYKLRSFSWDEAVVINQELHEHLYSLLKEDFLHFSVDDTVYMMLIGFYSPYFSDSPRENLLLRIAVREFATKRILAGNQEVIDNYRKRLLIRKQSYIPERPLRIGYISQSLRSHSVGFLARWLIKHHDRDNILIYGYLGNGYDQDPIRNWYISQFCKVDLESIVGNNLEVVINDAIDILIDLDSITAPHSASLVFKPAPIQATWLGWDANCLSSIDYFIADPYVLPDHAQEYYTEKIWRLPQTFLAVDGFEVGIPSLRRDLLDIPEDAIVYLSSQNTSKRHPRNVWCQLQILKQVPNSYLLLKSMNADQEAVENYLFELVDQEGIDRQRLKFLPITNTEQEHRANIRIADVVLDTYPYNGATHTMETLWMEVPLVTQVGEQFASRNSYSMMINAGLTEGIAKTDQEYIEWGVRLGIDQELRQQVIAKLHKAKHTAPLWNSRQFARDMETAYQQMWDIYLQSEDPDLKIDRQADRELFIAEAKIKNEDAVLFAQHNKLDKAIICWQTAIDWDPEYVDAYYNLGIAYNQLRDYERAVQSFEQAIKLKPNYPEALYNLGLTLVKLNRLDDALQSYQKALEISPDDIDIYIAIGNVYFYSKQKQLKPSLEAYESALAIDPKSSAALVGMGAVLVEMGEVDRAISCLNEALTIEPNDAQAYCNLGHAFMLKEQMNEAIYFYNKSLELDPTFADAYWQFNNYIVSFVSHPLYFNFPVRRQLADQFLNICYSTDPIRSSLVYLINYIYSGMTDPVQQRIEDLETYIFDYTSQLSNLDIEIIYTNLLFLVSSTRDSLEKNSRLFKLAGNLFAKEIIPLIKQRSDWHSEHKVQDIYHGDRPLRIGIISPNFGRHSVGWCSLPTIKQLAKITPHLYLYNTGLAKPDNLSREFECAGKYYWYEKELAIPEESSYDARLNRTSTDILNDQLDVLIDLDSVTHPFNLHLLNRKLAPICISWLGYDAPFLSSDNYWLGDQYTHPLGVDEYYVEKIVRLPDAHMAVSGFEAEEIDRDQARANLGISPNQVAYLMAAPGRKFNRGMAKAVVQILNQVPDAVLMYKGIVDLEVVKEVFDTECHAMGLDKERIKFLPVTKTEKEHRSVYQLADVFLDSYPYNGGTHNLEALWFNLPVVTHKGEQSFARMGYSFLQAVGINEGVANNWEEYIAWGVRYGLEPELRSAVRQQLIASKDPTNLAPLWNPQKLAQDIYNLFQSLMIGKS